MWAIGQSQPLYKNYLEEAVMRTMFSIGKLAASNILQAGNGQGS